MRMDYVLNLSSGFFDCLWTESAIENSGALEPDWGFGVRHPSYGASLIAQSVKNLPAVQETWALSLGWEDPLEKEMATHSSILAWKIPWTEEPGGLQSMGSQKSWNNWATNTSTSTHLMIIQWKWQICWRIWIWKTECLKNYGWRLVTSYRGSDQNYHTSCAHFTC